MSVFVIWQNSFQKGRQRETSEIQQEKIPLTLIFFYLLLGCPTATSGPLSWGKPR